MTKGFISMANKIENINMCNSTTGETVHIHNNIFRPATDKEYAKRFRAIHICMKMWIFGNALKLINYIFKKHIVQSIDDIPKTKENNHIRIFYQAYCDGLKLTCDNVLYKIQVKDDRTKEEYYNWFSHSNRSFNARMLLLNLWTTLLLEDTFDRGVHDYASLTFYKECKTLYKNNVPDIDTFRVYDSKEGRDIQYFIDIMNRDIWRKD